MKLKIGIFFGGRGRDRAWSLAEGRTLYQFLDKKLFEAIPVFLDSNLDMYEANPAWLLSNQSTEALFPETSLSSIPDTKAIVPPGKPLAVESLPGKINFAWITLNSEFDESSALQEKLSAMGIPFTGNHPDKQELAWDKILLKANLLQEEVTLPAYHTFTRAAIAERSPKELFEEIKATVGLPSYIKTVRGEVPAATSLIDHTSSLEELQNAVNRAFLKETLPAAEWLDRSEYEKQTYIHLICNPVEGPGLPVKVTTPGIETSVIDHAKSLYDWIDTRAKENPNIAFSIENTGAPDKVIVENAPAGKHFSCFVIRDANKRPVALPPASLRLKDELYFFGNPEASHPDEVKLLDATEQQILIIRQLAQKIYSSLSFGTMAQIEGTLYPDKQVAISEVRNAARIVDGSSLFKLTATTGLTPVALLSRLLQSSLYERSLDHPDKPAFRVLSEYLDDLVKQVQKTSAPRQRIGLLLADDCSDPLTAIESARFLFNHFEASENFEPVVFLAKGHNPFITINKVPKHWLFQYDLSNLSKQLKAQPAASQKTIPTDLKSHLDLAWLCIGDSRGVNGRLQEILEGQHLPFVGTDAKTVEHLSSRSHYLDILAKNGITVFDPDLHGEIHRELPMLAFPLIAHADGSVDMLPALEVPGKEISPNIRFQGKQKFIFEQDLQRSLLLEKEVYPTVGKTARIMALKGYALIYAFVQEQEEGKFRTLISEIDALPQVYKDSALIRSVLTKGKHPMETLKALIAEAKTPSRNTIEAKVDKKPTINKYFMETRQNHSEETPQPAPDKLALILGLLRKRSSKFIYTLWSFLRSPAFLRNIAAILVTLGILYGLLVFSLRIFTHHGSSIQIQDFTGMTIDQAREKAAANQLTLVITDSVFILEANPGTILNQLPEPFSRIKKNRSVYVTINSFMPPQVVLPSLVGNYDYNQYTRKLQRMGIKYRIIEKRFDQKLEANTILFFYFNGEEITDARLREGVKVPKGSTLDFVVTERRSDQVSIPDLTCKTYNQAAFVLSSMNLEIGQVFGEFANYDEAWVYRQDPPESGDIMVPVGTRVNLYLSAEYPAACAGTTSNPQDAPENNN